MRRPLIVLALATALTLLMGRWASVIYADWQWYSAMGALPVYASALAHQAAWRVGAAGVAFVFAFLNLYALRRSIVSLVLPRRLGNLDIGEAISPRMLLAFVAATAALLAVLLSAPTGEWTTFALARHAGLFREMDPYLDRDLSFAMAQLPFERDLYDWAGRALVVITILIVTLYALTPSLRLRMRRFYVSAWCRRHLATLAAFAILMLAWRWRLEAASLTSTGVDAADVFGAYDQRVGMPLIGWLAALTAVSAFVVFWAGWHGHVRTAAVAGLAACVAGPLANGTLPVLAERRRAQTQRVDEERSFTSTRRLFTRRAFGVDAIAGVAAPPDGEVRTGLPATIPAWDPAALERSVSPGGTPATYRGIAWRLAAGALRATVVAEGGAGAPGWTGVTFEPALSDERGRAQPALPLGRETPALVAWPRVLVAPGLTGVAIVDDTSGHSPAPPFDRWLDRLAQAWSLRSPRLLGAEPLAVRPRIVVRRDVRERVQALAPFLTVGPTMVPLVRDDSLYWVAELFTTARYYPLSDRLMFAGAFRPYVHHAATAFVQAATGRVLLVADPQPDAIMRTWMRRFRTLFLEPDHLPRALAGERPPAYDWAAVQATALARSGFGPTTSATRFTVATDNADADLFGPTPSCFAVDGREASIAWSAPLLDAAGIVAGLVVATGGDTPATAWVGARRQDRWSDVLDRLQSAADSAGIGKQRRNARRGRVTAVPVQGGIAYVQAHYEWAADAAPTLAGVAGLSDGLTRAGHAAGEALGQPAPPVATAGGAFRASVDALYRRMDDALRRGDWPGFGSAFTALGQLLRGGGR